MCVPLFREYGLLDYFDQFIIHGFNETIPMRVVIKRMVQYNFIFQCKFKSFNDEMYVAL